MKIKFQKKDFGKVKELLENEKDNSLLKSVLGGGPICEKGVAYADSIFYNAFGRLPL